MVERDLNQIKEDCAQAVQKALSEVGTIDPKETLYRQFEGSTVMINPRESSTNPGSFDDLVTIFPLNYSTKLLDGYQLTARQLDSEEFMTKALNIRGQCVFHGMKYVFTLELSSPIEPEEK